MNDLAYVCSYCKVKEIEKWKAGKEKSSGNPELHFFNMCPQMLEGPSRSMEIRMCIIIASEVLMSSLEVKIPAFAWGKAFLIFRLQKCFQNKDIFP